MSEHNHRPSRNEVGGLVVGGALLAVGSFATKKVLDRRHFRIAPPEVVPQTDRDYARLAQILEDERGNRIVWHYSVNAVAAYLATHGCATREQVMDQAGVIPRNFAAAMDFLAPKKGSEELLLARRVDRQQHCQLQGLPGINHYEPTDNLLVLAAQGLGGDTFQKLLLEYQKPVAERES